LIMGVFERRKRHKDGNDIKKEMNDVDEVDRMDRMDKMDEVDGMDWTARRGKDFFERFSCTQTPLPKGRGE